MVRYYITEMYIASLITAALQNICMAFLTQIYSAKSTKECN